MLQARFNNPVTWTAEYVYWCSALRSLGGESSWLGELLPEDELSIFEEGEFEAGCFSVCREESEAPALEAGGAGFECLDGFAPVPDLSPDGLDELAEEPRFLSDSRVCESVELVGCAGGLS